VHGQMCLSQIGCVTAAKHNADFERGPATQVVKKIKTTTTLVTVTSPG
jgi:hypothetical protein